jgi:hypothetical protein
LFFVLTTVAYGQNSVNLQEQMDALSQEPPNGVIAGPFGVPRLVVNDAGVWKDPIEVYSDAKVRVFIPDITDPAWAQWYAASFREKGTYFSYFYVYGRKTRAVTRMLIAVDTKANTATVELPLIAPETGKIAALPLAYRGAIARTTALVHEEVARFKGPSAQDYLEQQRKFTAWMAGQDNH